MPAQAKGRRRGAAVVEFALVFPLFLLFVFTLIELSRGLMVTSLLTNAARSGCRQGILSTSTNTDVENAVADRTKGMGLASPTVTITVNGDAKDVSTAQAQDEVKVVVSVPYADVTWLPMARWLSGNMTGKFSLPHE